MPSCHRHRDILPNEWFPIGSRKRKIPTPPPHARKYLDRAKPLEWSKSWELSRKVGVRSISRFEDFGSVRRKHNGRWQYLSRIKISCFEKQKLFYSREKRSRLVSRTSNATCSWWSPIMTQWNSHRRKCVCRENVTVPKPSGFIIKRLGQLWRRPAAAST